MNNDKTLSKKYLVLDFKCRDLEVYTSDASMQKCQYCMNLREEKKPIELWVCKMPSREAQRRHFAGLDGKQRALV